MSNDNTRPSVKHALGKTIGTWPAWWTLTIAAGATIFTTVPDAINGEANPLDYQGVEQQQELVAQHEADFAALQEMKGQIELLEAQAGLGGENEKLTALKTTFSEKAVNDYVDLYMDGATKDGPALSEENFNRLQQAFTENVADPSAFGFHAAIDAGLLNETMAETELKTGSDVDRFQTAKAMDEKMADAVKDPADGYFASGIGTLLSAFLLYIICASISEWQKAPSRVPRRKSKPAYGKH
ncbi:MAG: hypothetical protein HND56_09510 [Pseudomonadota bacterium]|nr:hypothetical protein [Pseudomonadota bacterium]QKK05908.1 MAG: hypothetical protein HND56_09510 [Pseudomonadota bacterium]